MFVVALTLVVEVTLVDLWTMRLSAGASVDHNIKTQHTDYHLSGTCMYLTDRIKFKVLTTLPMTIDLKILYSLHSQDLH